ncbi:MAG: hypothetical protein H7243_02040, partial [Sphingomonadaceae bacterium]|nr:hypothetical protein [Sphingomonadaceae bacterium]
MTPCGAGDGGRPLRRSIDRRGRAGLALVALLAASACATHPGGDARVTFDLTGVTTRAASGHASGHGFTPETVVRVASVSK